MKARTTLLLFVLILSLSAGIITLTTSGMQAYDDENGVKTSEGNDFAESFGVLAMVMLSLAAIYVFLKRSFLLSKKYFPKTPEYDEITQLIKTVYLKFRKPAFYLHEITTILATIFAIIHGYSLAFSNGQLIESPIVYAGMLAVGSMIIMSISGGIMWYKVRPLWSAKGIKTSIQWIHRQWFFTGLMILGILLHFAFGD